MTQQPTPDRQTESDPSDDPFVHTTALLRADLERHVADARHGVAAGDLGALRPIVRDWVTLMRRDGASIERAIIAMKALMTETGFAMLGLADERACAEVVVKWCILHYFDTAA